VPFAFGSSDHRCNQKIQGQENGLHFFKQNRGLLLQQLVDKDIAERMIFSLE